MSYDVMLSIRPKYVELIRAEKKTLEVRKTRPARPLPFRCFIYETKGKTETPWMDEDGHMIFRGSGQVIGEFVCDRIDEIMISCSDPNIRGIAIQGTGLTDREIMDYLGNGVTGYGWHISNLFIYDEPLELKHFQIPTTYPARRLRQAPQSWGYVELFASEAIRALENGIAAAAKIPTEILTGRSGDRDEKSS